MIVYETLFIVTD